MCSRCKLRLLAVHRRLPRQLGRRVELASPTPNARSYATVLPETSKPKVDWQAWFDSAAPYPPHTSSAALDDRRRRSHHDRGWIPPLPLYASFAPALEPIRKDSSEPYATLPVQPAELQLKDEEWVRRTLDYPIEQDYPTAPSELFSAPSTKSLAHAFSAVKPPELVTFSKFRLVKDFEAVEYWRNYITAKYPHGETFTATGEGFTKEGAGKASLMSLIAILHSQSQLRKTHEEHKPPLSSWKTPDADNSSQAVLHVYNYAAHLGTVPRFTRQQDTEDIANIGERTVYRVTVTVDLSSGSSVSGTGIGRDRSNAERRACLDFKSQAESAQYSNGPAIIDLKDINAVSLDNAEHILSLFKASFPYEKLERHSEHSSRDFEVPWKCYYTLNGEVLDEAVVMPYRKDALQLAQLVAAVALTKAYPILLDRIQTARKQTSGLLLPPELPLPAKKLGNLSSVLPPIISELDSMHHGDADAEPDDYNTLERVQMRAELNMTRTLQARQHAHAHEISLEARNESLEFAQQFYRFSPALESLRATREALPVSEMRDFILSSIQHNTFNIIVGSTGSGKSTQVPQMILEDAIDRGIGALCNVVCTEPRRVAVKSLAQRVAEERDELLGEVVGYQMGGDVVVSKLGGSITFSTPETQTLQLSGGVDVALDNISHFIIDEAHERDPHTDRLLATLKLAIEDRERRRLPCPKVIIMSATLDTGLFERYFGDNGLRSIRTIEVPGRLYPVDEIYLPDILKEMRNTFHPEELNQLIGTPYVAKYLRAEQLFALQHAQLSNPDQAIQERARSQIQWLSNRETDLTRRDVVVFDLIAATVAHILKSSINGDVLVFLPGWGDIFRVKENLQRYANFDYGLEGSHQFKIVVLHSKRREGLLEATSSLPHGVRRVILATNIAETSVTLPDVSFIVDPGIHRQAQPHPVNGALVFRDMWISQASASQRAGRAGRVSPGKYYALFTKQRRDSFDLVTPLAPKLGPFSAETMRTVLRNKKLFPNQPALAYFKKTLTPPLESEVTGALAELQSLGAMSESEELTYLGELLALFPQHPQSAIIIFLGVIFECLEPMLVILMSLDEKEIYLRPQDEQAKLRLLTLRKLHAQGTMSDHIALLNVYREVQQMKEREGEDRARDWARDNQVDYDHYLLLERQVGIYIHLLFRRGIVSQMTPFPCDANASDLQLIQSLTAAALWPNVAIHSHNDVFWTPKGVNALLRRSSPMQAAYDSTVARDKSGQSSILDGSVVCFSGWSSILGRYGRLTNVTPVTPLALILFGGKLMLKPGTDDTLLIDDWFTMRVPGTDAAAKMIEFKNAWTKVWRASLKSFARGIKPGYEGRREAYARSMFVQRVVELIRVEYSDLDIQLHETHDIEEVDGHVLYNPADPINDSPADRLRRSLQQRFDADDEAVAENGQRGDDLNLSPFDDVQVDNEAEEVLEDKAFNDDADKSYDQAQEEHRFVSDRDMHFKPPTVRMAYPHQQYGGDATALGSATASNTRGAKKERKNLEYDMSELPHEV